MEQLSELAQRDAEVRSWSCSGVEAVEWRVVVVRWWWDDGDGGTRNAVD